MLRLSVEALASKLKPSLRGIRIPSLFYDTIPHSYSVNPPKDRHASYGPGPTVTRKKHSSHGDHLAVDSPEMIISSMFTKQLNHYHTPTLTSERDPPINKHHHYHLPTLPEKKNLPYYTGPSSISHKLSSYYYHTSPEHLHHNPSLPPTTVRPATQHVQHMTDPSPWNSTFPQTRVKNPCVCGWLILSLLNLFIYFLPEGGIGYYKLRVCQGFIYGYSGIWE